MDCFAFYGIKRSFNFDQNELRMHYLKMSKAHHPDFFVGNEEKYQEALDITAKNNEAYKVLQDPQLTLKHILELHDMLQNTKESLPPAFLMEMMDINERLMDAKMEGAEQGLAEVLKEVEEFEASLDNAFSQQRESYDVEGASAELLAQLKDTYLKLRYLRRLKQQLH